VPDATPAPDSNPDFLGTLPEGDTGIASQFTDDRGIESHPDGIFADDFESYGDASDLTQRWDAAYRYVGIAREPANIFAGSQSVEFTVPQQNQELSNKIWKSLVPEEDIVFLRYYSKFASTNNVTGSSHNGATISSHYEDNGSATPGIPADGFNKFLVAFENWRGDSSTAPAPGQLNVYVYHPTQRSNYGDHFFPTGEVLPNTSILFDFGSNFVPRPHVVQELDRWYCYELMVKANSVGQRDGRIAFWLEGKLIADFQNLRLRDTKDLTMDRIGLGLHIKSNTSGETKKWYDNVVVARSYIGPLKRP